MGHISHVSHVDSHVDLQSSNQRGAIGSVHGALLQLTRSTRPSHTEIMKLWILRTEVSGAPIDDALIRRTARDIVKLIALWAAYGNGSLGYPRIVARTARDLGALLGYPRNTASAK